MQKRKVKFKESDKITPCPKCENKTEFTIISNQFTEDCCEVWAKCKCGHEPELNERFEDVMGGVHDDNVKAAIQCWNISMHREEF